MSVYLVYKGIFSSPFLNIGLSLFIRLLAFHQFSRSFQRLYSAILRSFLPTPSTPWDLINLLLESWTHLRWCSGFYYTFINSELNFFSHVRKGSLPLLRDDLFHIIIFPCCLTHSLLEYYFEHILKSFLLHFAFLSNLISKLYPLWFHHDRFELQACIPLLLLAPASIA